MEQQSEEKKKQRKKSDKKKILWLSAASVVVVALIIGLSYAWFFNQSDMATLIKIGQPSDIAILGPGGNERASLSLEYTDDDKTTGTDGTTTVTIKRVFCVQSQANYHKLEIAHTTNMKGLTFKIYPTTATGSNSVTDDGYTYAYDPNKPISGQYINKERETNSYKYADNTKHNDNYGRYQKVQSHAEPIYWLASDKLAASTDDANKVTIKDKTYSRTYYVLEISWTETTKETDIFYILAKDVTDSEAQ